MDFCDKFQIFIYLQLFQNQINLHAVVFIIIICKVSLLHHYSNMTQVEFIIEEPLQGTTIHVVTIMASDHPIQSNTLPLSNKKR